MACSDHKKATGNFPYGIKKRNWGPKKAMFSMGANFRGGQDRVFGP